MPTFILPAYTNFERVDISEFGNCSGYIPHTGAQVNHRMVVLQKKCIEPLGESKSDYEIFRMFAERLGIGPIFTMGGMDEYAWVKKYFYATDLPKIISWEDFEEKGYVVIPFPKDHKSTPAMRWFAEGREKDTPDWGPHPGRHRRPQGSADDHRGRSSSCRAASRGSKKVATSIPSGRSWARNTSRRGRVTARRATPRTPCRWSRRIRGSAFTPWATPRRVG